MHDKKRLNRVKRNLINVQFAILCVNKTETTHAAIMSVKCNV